MAQNSNAIAGSLSFGAVVADQPLFNRFQIIIDDAGGFDMHPGFDLFQPAVPNGDLPRLRCGEDVCRRDDAVLVMQ